MRLLIRKIKSKNSFGRKQYLNLLKVTAVLFSYVLIIPSTAYAIDVDFYSQNDILFYKPIDSTCGVAGVYGTSSSSISREQFIDKYGQGAFDIGQKYGIPYEAMLAQGAVESGNGNSELTTKYNNFFGIKASSGWNGDKVAMPTKEEVDGQSIDTVAWFRAYPTIEAGWQGYAQFIIENPRYKPALAYPTDYVRYIEEVAKAGYATSSKYTDTVVSVANSIADYIKSTNKWPPSSSLTPPAGPVDFSTASTSCSVSTGQGGTGGDALSGNETVDLASGYYLKSNDPKMIYYYQYENQRWLDPNKNIYTGPGNNYSECGCFTFSMAMAINTVGPDKTITPYDIGDVVKAKGAVASGGCGYDGGDPWPMANLQDRFGVKIKLINSVEEAVTGIQNGGLVVASMHAGTFTSGNHYIVLRGVTQDGKIAVANSTNMDQSLTGTYTQEHIASQRNIGRMWVVSAK